MEQMNRERRGLRRLPLWVWLALILSLLIAALWLTDWAIRKALPPSEEGALQVVPTFTPTSPAAAQAPVVTPAGDVTAEPALEPAATELAAPESAAATEPAPTEAATPTPLPPTSPPPTAAPTPLPDERMALGAQAYRLGDYGAARSHLAALLANQDIANDLRRLAQFELAKAYLAEEYYAEALAALDQLQAEDDLGLAASAVGPFSLQEVRDLADFLRGEALAGLGRFDEAVAVYTRFLQGYPATVVAVQTKLAELYMAQGNTEAAANAYRAAADGATNASQRAGLLETAASIHTNAGRHAAAAAVYDAILDMAQIPYYRAEVMNKAGHALAAAGDQGAAVERWQAAIAEARPFFTTEPATGTAASDAESMQQWQTAAGRSRSIRAAYEALVELVDRQVDFDLYERGYIDLVASAWTPAVNAFTAYLESVPADDPRAGLAVHGLGRSYLGAGDPAAALAAFERVLAEYPDCACTAQARLDIARATAAQGDGAGARRLYRTFARDFPDDPLAPEAMWQSALLALNEDNSLEAAVDALVLADAFPDSALAPQALFWVGTGAFHSGLYNEAADTYARLQRQYPDYRWDATGYWLGRAYQAQGNTDAANAQWQALVDRAPDIYYGILAAQSLRQLPFTGGSMLTAMSAVAGPVGRLAGDDGTQAFAEQWLAAWLQVDPAALANLPAHISADADLAAGRVLLELDARGEGLAALERVYERALQDPQALYALSLEFERMGAYRLSLMAMARVIEQSPANLVEDAPIFLQKRVYPLRFRDLITEQAVAHNLDPLLLFSLIRQESLFEEGARSVASAQGLAQIMPATGVEIAGQLGYPDYTNDLVYRPIVNVRFGAYYLDRARDYLDGNLVSALVGYNAGPGASQGWRAASGPDDTIFVELLALTEPRVYVRTITANLYHYYRLYDGG